MGWLFQCGCLSIIIWFLQLMSAYGCFWCLYMYDWMPLDDLLDLFFPSLFLKPRLSSAFELSDSWRGPWSSKLGPHLPGCIACMGFCPDLCLSFNSYVSIYLFLVADTRLYTLPCRSVGRSVRPSITFLNCEWFSHNGSCPTVRDWIAMYPALFSRSSGNEMRKKKKDE